MSTLVINAAFYIITIVYFYAKDRKISIRIAICVLYFIFAFFGCIIVNNLLFFEVYGRYNLSHISIIPYLLNYLTVVIIIQNLREKKLTTKIKQYTIKPKFKLHFENVCVFLCLLVIFFSLLFLYKNFRYSMSDIYSMGREYNEKVFFQNRLYNIILYRGAHILVWLTPFVCIFEFLSIIKREQVKRSFIIIFVLFVSILIQAFVISNRGGIFFACSNIVFFFMLFWNFLQSKIKKYLIISFSIFIGIILTGFAYITISRSQNDLDLVSDSVLRYFGETFPNLGLRVWNVSDEYINGERKFPFFYNFFGSEVQNFGRDRNIMVSYFEVKYGFPINNFITFFGDLYAEFGVFVSLIFVLIYVKLMNYLIKTTSSILYIVFSYVSYTVLIWGIFACKFNESFFLSLFFYIVCVRIIERRHIIKKDYGNVFSYQ